MKTFYYFFFGDRLKNFVKTFFFFFFFGEHLRFVSLVRGLGLEHSCPWPRECLSSERLALASDFFVSLALSLVSSTPPLVINISFYSLDSRTRIDAVKLIVRKYLLLWWSFRVLEVIFYSLI